MNKPQDSLSLLRQHRTVLVTGHRPDRLPQCDAGLRQIEVAMSAVLSAIEASYHFFNPGCVTGLRVLTGFADGTDAMASDLASNGTVGRCLHLLGTNLPPGQEERLGKAQRVAVISDQAMEIPGDALIAAADDAKLALADAVIVVWDGDPPRGYAGGAVRIMLEAIQRFTPVIWIDARIESAGMIRLLNTARLNDATLVSIETDDSDMQYIQRLFELPGDDLSQALQQLLAPFWNKNSLSYIHDQLNSKKIDPQQQNTLSGFWHTSLLALAGSWRIKKIRPLQAWRGPQAFVDACQLPETNWLWFDRHDRAAMHAANTHRDHVVLIHLMASLAVFGAIAGAITLNWQWGVFELGMLVVVWFIVYTRHYKDINKDIKSLDIWLRFRQSAEAFRSNAILYPLLASLPALHRGVWRCSSTSGKAQLAKHSHWMILQLMREAGIPDQEKKWGIQARAEAIYHGLDAWLGDQIVYHQNAHQRYHHSHERLHNTTLCIFWLILATVIIEIAVHLLAHASLEQGSRLKWLVESLTDAHWLLLITGFLPALAAALHGVGTRLEMQRMARNSNTMAAKLGSLRDSLHEIHHHPDPVFLRAIAIKAASITFAEHDNWAELMAEQSVDIPA